MDQILLPFQYLVLLTEYVKDGDDILYCTFAVEYTLFHVVYYYNFLSDASPLCLARHQHTNGLPPNAS